jgi:hypothetical protein
MSTEKETYFTTKEIYFFWKAAMKKPLVSRSLAPGSNLCTISLSSSVSPHPALPAAAILQSRQWMARIT